MDLSELDTLTTDDLKVALAAIQEILGRRYTLETAEQRAEELAREVLDAEGLSCGDPWRPPSGAHDAYPQGWTVDHDGGVWESLISGNAHEPGVSGWRQVTTGDQPAPWVQPAGAHDAYGLGDRVTHDGSVWESTVDANVWAPGVHGWTITDSQEA